MDSKNNFKNIGNNIDLIAAASHKLRENLSIGYNFGGSYNFDNESFTVIYTLALGIGLTDIRSVSSTSHNIFTSLDHGLNRITRVSITNAGTGYGSGTAGDLYNAKLVGIGASTTGANATARANEERTFCTDEWRFSSLVEEN